MDKRMSDTSTDSTGQVLLKDAEFKLQTTVPSAIRTRASVVDGVSGSASSTLRGSQSSTLVISGGAFLPDGWARVRHPDSGVYYVNKDKGLSTSSDVRDSRSYSLISKAADKLHISHALQLLRKGEKVDVVVDISQNNGAAGTASYYCVSHVERRIFWLEGIEDKEVGIPCTSNKCTKLKDASRAHCIEAQYWKHCELFPTTFTVTKNVTKNLKDILLQATADRLLVRFSTSPYNKDALECMLNIVKEIEADPHEESAHSAWIIARFMGLYNDGLLQSSYGQSDDFFDIEDTRPPEPYERPVLLAILGPFLFKSPDVFARGLHSFHEDFTPERWSNFVHKVDQSIRDSNLLATVLLGTNVALLAWADGGRSDGINNPTAAQIVTYISILCSVGSIIIGLVIFKQYRAKGADTPLRAVIVLRRILKERFGLERLAIICSLPYVLLMWGLIAFLVAFGIVFYSDTGIQVRIPVTVALALLVLCLFFCMYTAGPPEKEDEEAKKRSRKTEDTMDSKV